MQTENKAVLSTAYFGNIQYFTKFIKYPEVLIELFENYPKQTFRNRCNIYSANGILPLSIPVIKPRSPKSLTKEILIDYTEKWQKTHFKAIESAYNRSPFYPFYIDELTWVFTSNEKYLIDLNMKILEYLLDLLEIESNIDLTNQYDFDPEESSIADLREVMHPKKQKRRADHHFRPVQYFQVFSEKYGFLNNLSVLDLLFNVGPETTSILDACIVD